MEKLRGRNRKRCSVKWIGIINELVNVMEVTNCATRVFNSKMILVRILQGRRLESGIKKGAINNDSLNHSFSEV